VDENNPGLVKFDNKNWSLFDTINFLGEDWFFISLSADAHGQIWGNTGGKGLFKFDGIYWTFYNTANSGINENYTTSVAIDAAGNKWIGTYYGLNKFNDTTWSHYIF
jgi:ligand-binding sensor domain-containing protein